MATKAEWALGYARQAKADFIAFEGIQQLSAINECHKMLFLQMACEKLCKAFLILGGTTAQALQSSHGYIANPLPVVIRQQIVALKGTPNAMKGVQALTKHLANEIEMLNPAIDRVGQRPDNCEYPWEDASQSLHSPLDWQFGPSQLLITPNGRTFLKLVYAAIIGLLSELGQL